ncbi:MAG TPA: DegT/DnrJ/EryC1/StrS family aminotransferase [Pyrinomonadaceae bacterium]|nr:DegT/DnrJ/EryC1/StrS family aminotransferase [Pyrinomonadaceae bacterium]
MPNIKKVVRKSVKLAAKGVIHTLPTLPGRSGRLTGKLAKEGGLPVRDVRYRPWPSYPSSSLTEWTTQLAPRFLQIFLSGVEGLPQPLAKKFCEEWARYCGARYALLVPHGTDALRVAVTAALDHDGMEYGGEIIVPNLSFIASATTVLDRRFGVTLVDVDPETYLIDPQRVEEAIIPGKTRAIMAVHLFGQPADMAALSDIAKRHSLVLLEDAAQAHGAIHELGRVGAIGDAAGFSFQSSKNLSAGEGGAFTTNDPEVFERAYSFHNVGRARHGGQRWGHNSLGFNMRGSEYIAAVLLHRLQKLEAQQQRRADNYQRLREYLSAVPCVSPLAIGPGVKRHGVHMCELRYDPELCDGLRIEDFIKAIQAEGLPLNRGYEATMAQQPALQQMAEKHPSYLRVLPTPVSDAAVKNMLFLPHEIFLGSDADMREVAAAFAKVQARYQPQAIKPKTPAVTPRIDTASATVAASEAARVTAKANPVRFGVIGLGVMGQEHARVIAANSGLELVGVTDIQANTGRKVAADLNCRWFGSDDEMIQSGAVDAIVIATPHWQHGELAIKALKGGLHVLCEKPLTVTVAQADEVLRAATESRGTFVVVHQKRFEPAYLYVKQLLDSGELGPIYRCSMIESAWRSETYYRASPWRGTWKGEGGGVLLNQAPHILDRYAWLCGMPETVTARCDTSLHDIEVEDTASAILHHANGTHGYIHISTIEAPPIARTVICCDRGRITIENGKVQVSRLRDSIRERTEHDTQLMGELESDTRTIQVPGGGDALSAFYDDFVSAVQGSGSLTCPGHEGINAVELANAMLLSSAEGTAIRLPLDRRQYSEFIEAKMLSTEPQPV